MDRILRKSLYCVVAPVALTTCARYLNFYKGVLSRRNNNNRRLSDDIELKNNIIITIKRRDIVIEYSRDAIFHICYYYVRWHAEYELVFPSYLRDKKMPSPASPVRYTAHRRAAVPPSNDTLSHRFEVTLLSLNTRVAYRLWLSLPLPLSLTTVPS